MRLYALQHDQEAGRRRGASICEYRKDGFLARYKTLSHILTTDKDTWLDPIATSSTGTVDGIRIENLHNSYFPTPQ
jgi:hypothetical protein